MHRTCSTIIDKLEYSIGSSGSTCKPKAGENLIYVALLDLCECERVAQLRCLQNISQVFAIG